MTARSWSAVLLALIWASAALAAPLPPSGTFIYSDACTSEGGDFAGYRVTLTHRPGVLRAVIEFNDEGPDGRDTARNVAFDANSGKLSFTFQDSQGGKMSFEGVLSQDNLKARVDDNDVTLRLLKKVPKYLPDCGSNPHF